MNHEIKSDSSLLRIAKGVVDDCHRLNKIPTESVLATQSWVREMENLSDIEASDLVSLQYGKFLLATAEGPEIIVDRGRALIGVVLGAMHIAKGESKVSFAPMLNAEDHRNSVLADLDACQIVKEKYEELEQQVPKLLKEKEDLEHEVLGLKEVNQALTGKVKQLEEALQAKEKALSESMAQTRSPAPPEPLVVSLSKMLVGHKQEIKTLLIDMNRDRVRERVAAAEQTVKLVEMIEREPNVCEAIKKNELLAPAYELIVQSIRNNVG